jgi:hypothetical protein
MIEGIKIDMTCEELRAHVKFRVDHHVKKHNFYAQQVETLSVGREAMANISNDPVTSLKHSMETHKERAAFFNVLAEHLIEGEVYRLSESDLMRLELFSRYF